jgi:glutamine cyclotransferase
MSISLSLFFAAALQTFSVVDSLPHSTAHFTQGLNFDGKEWIESTGLHGKSALNRKTLSCEILDSVYLEERYFGEGTFV